MMQIKTSIGLLLILSILSMSMGAFAESEIGVLESDIDIQTIPENPEPYQSVTVILSSYLTDVNKAMIEWRSGSKTLLSGYGKTSYSFTALGPNTTTIIDIIITPVGSIDRIIKRVAVSPAEIDILWEGVDSYTPPFYRGKSFITREGWIKAVAMPNTNSIKQSKGRISYTWKSSDNTVLSASGYNKDSFVFVNSELNDKENVTVNASSIDGAYNATKTINIPIVDPKIIFYKKSPTEGVLYNNALSDQSFMEEEEMTLVAEPYFVALRGNESKFTYSWQINGEDIETPSNKMELTVRPTSRGGYATISIVLENLSTFFQKASGSLKLNL